MRSTERQHFRTSVYRLEALKGNRAGDFSLRVNDPYRITFRFEKGDAGNVTCEDYQDGPRSVLDLKRPPTPPGEMLLEEFLRPAGLIQVEAARRMKIPIDRLNEIIRGRWGISADTVLRLARLFKTSPEFWMGLQSDWDLWHGPGHNAKRETSQRTHGRTSRL